MRANCANSSTRFLSASTSPTIARVHSSTTFSKSGARLEPGLAHALGRELDRRQRVLDLVGEPARHLAPGRHLLRAHERRHVVEDDHGAPGAEPSEPGRRHHGRRPGGGRARARARCTSRSWRETRPGEQAQHEREDLLAARAAQDLSRAAARRAPASSSSRRQAAAFTAVTVASCVDHDDAGADGLEHRLREPPALLELLVLARRAPRAMNSTSSSLRASRSDMRLKEAMRARNSSLPVGKSTRTPRSPGGDALGALGHQPQRRRDAPREVERRARPRRTGSSSAGNR